jgi:hypothetical protein
VKAKTKIRLLAMSKVMKEKRLDELNQKLGITHPDILTEYDQEEMEERQWLEEKLGYQQHRIRSKWTATKSTPHSIPDVRSADTRFRRRGSSALTLSVCSVLSAGNGSSLSDWRTNRRVGRLE